MPSAARRLTLKRRWWSSAFTRMHVARRAARSLYCLVDEPPCVYQKSASFDRSHPSATSLSGASGSFPFAVRPVGHSFVDWSTITLRRLPSLPPPRPACGGAAAPGTLCVGVGPCPWTIPATIFSSISKRCASAPAGVAGESPVTLCTFSNSQTIASFFVSSFLLGGWEEG